MYLDNYDMAKVRMEARVRDAEHHRLIKEARAAHKAARPERVGLLAAMRHVTGHLRTVSWKHAAATPTGSTTPSVGYV